MTDAQLEAIQLPPVPLFKGNSTVRAIPGIFQGEQLGYL